MAVNGSERERGAGCYVTNLLLFCKELCITGSQSCMVNHSDILQ
jgi:hypothetical protein